ncbi:hypothetical protein B1R94_11325 [Mycolicibacterium litorale]|nr:hypothetical protein B1R94_11325 [Mycolicibacterium litorale]
MTVVVIGVGNELRRDDGVGPAVAAEVARQCPPGVRVVTCAVEPTAILDAWDGTELAVIVDAVSSAQPTDVRAGRVRPCTVADVADAGGCGSHEMSLPQIYALGRALGRVPGRVVVVAVDAADVGYGVGLSAPVAAAVPAAAAAVHAELGRWRG